MKKRKSEPCTEGCEERGPPEYIGGGWEEQRSIVMLDSTASTIQSAIAWPEPPLRDISEGVGAAGVLLLVPHSPELLQLKHT